MQLVNAHTGFLITCLLFTDNNRIISGSDDGSLRVWSVETGDVSITLKTTLTKLVLRYLIITLSFVVRIFPFWSHWWRMGCRRGRCRTGKRIHG